MTQLIKNDIQKSIETKEAFLHDTQCIQSLTNIATAAINIYKQGRKILLAGNGGSAADAQHIAGELVSRFNFDRPGIPAIALTTDSSILTAIGNDYGYDKLFSRQIQAQAVPGDMFIGISTSGNSSNIIQALHECKKKEVVAVGLTGDSGGEMANLCNYCIKVPSSQTPRIQEVHILIGHIICATVERALFKSTVT